MPHSRLDHIIVTCASLEAGVAHVRRALGVEMQKGGEHVRMGTHNCLLRLGEKLFLEVIAANPAAPPPGRPRWFQLDEPESVRSPRLATWVARCDDIRALAPASLGKIEAMSRGSFEWLITVPADGRLPLGGIAPTLIEWRSSAHPADGLKDLGCSLDRFEGFHPRPEKVTAMLKSIGFEGEFPVSKGEAGLVAHVQTPAGAKRLSSA
jgi:Glyoxalase-like domain